MLFHMCLPVLSVRINKAMMTPALNLSSYRPGKCCRDFASEAGIINDQLFVRRKALAI